MTAKSLAGRLAAMLTCAALIAGCGSSKKDTTSQPATTSTPSGAPTTVNGAVAKCLEQAKSVPEASARKTAEEACKAVKSGDTSGVKAAARKQCLEAAQKVPAGPARDQTVAACDKGTK
jgi:hypothetical protein